MQLTEVTAVLADLSHTGCRFWVAGGWGVDALTGRQTRPHRDLDLAIDAQHEAAAMDALGRRGYTVETDWRPVRVELVAPSSGWVDLHPVVFDRTGHGRQADMDGGSFDYPTDAFTEGILAGSVVPCLSHQQQVRFHHGYEPLAADVHDLRLLDELASGELRPRIDDSPGADRSGRCSEGLSQQAGRRSGPGLGAR